MALWGDFKKFAFKGSVVDLAVGVVIGAAFGKIVTALVADMIMPIVSLALPAGDWRTAGVLLRAGATPKDDVVLKWGDFLGTVLDFAIVAFAIFLFVSRILKAVKLHADPDVKECAFCLEMIPGKAKKCKACTADVVAPGAKAKAATAD